MQEWRDFAACRGVSTRLFLSSVTSEEREAKAICAECPARPACLSFAMRQERAGEVVVGIYGGLTEDERWKLRAYGWRTCIRCGERFIPYRVDAGRCPECAVIRRGQRAS